MGPHSRAGGKYKRCLHVATPSVVFSQASDGGPEVAVLVGRVDNKEEPRVQCRGEQGTVKLCQLYIRPSHNPQRVVPVCDHLSPGTWWEGILEM